MRWSTQGQPGDRRTARKTRLLLRRGLLPALLTVISLVGTAWWIWATPSVVIDSLAVLPLRNISGDSAQVYFVDAMHGAIIAELGRVAALRTISQWSALRYRNTDKSIPEIARELGVDALVEADVVTNGQNVRIQVQLVQAVPRERKLWTNTYEGDLGQCPESPK